MENKLLMTTEEVLELYRRAEEKTERIKKKCEAMENEISKETDPSNKLKKMWILLCMEEFLAD